VIQTLHLTGLANFPVNNHHSLQTPTYLCDLQQSHSHSQIMSNASSPINPNSHHPHHIPHAERQRIILGVSIFLGIGILVVIALAIALAILIHKLNKALALRNEQAEQAAPRVQGTEDTGVEMHPLPDPVGKRTETGS